MAASKREIKVIVYIIEGDESNKILAKPYIWFPVAGQIGPGKGRCTPCSELPDITGSKPSGNSESAPALVPCHLGGAGRGEGRNERKKGTHSHFCIFVGCLSVGSLSLVLPLPQRKANIRYA